MTMEEDKYKVAENMERYGGSFTQALAVLIMKADARNIKKIKKAWPKEWNKYRQDDPFSQTL